MTPRLSDHFSIFGLFFVVLKSLLGTARQWSRENFAILSLKPRSQAGLLNKQKLKGHFRVALSKWGQAHSLSCENEFDLHENEKSKCSAYTYLATFSELAASRKSSNSELGMPVLLNWKSLIIFTVATAAILNSEISKQYQLFGEQFEVRFITYFLTIFVLQPHKSQKNSLLHYLTCRK